MNILKELIFVFAFLITFRVLHPYAEKAYEALYSAIWINLFFLVFSFAVCGIICLFLPYSKPIISAVYKTLLNNDFRHFSILALSLTHIVEDASNKQIKWKKWGYFSVIILFLIYGVFHF